MRDVGYLIAFAGSLLALVAAAIGLVGAFHLSRLRVGSPTFEADMRTQERVLNWAFTFLMPAVALVVLGALVMMAARGIEALS